MKNSLSAATWKRLTLTLALSTAGLLGLMAPVSQVNATAVHPVCDWSHNGIIIYYSDPAKLHGICQESLPCYGGQESNHCTSSHTNYWTIFCSGVCGQP